MKPLRPNVLNPLQLILIVPILVIVLGAVTVTDYIVNEYLVAGPKNWHLYPYWAISWEVMKIALVLITSIFIFVLSRNFVTTFLWAFTLYVPLVTGSEDVLYYFLQGQQVPDTLEWLDQARLIQWGRYVFNVEHVTRESLYFTATVGWLVIVILWVGLGVLSFANLRRAGRMI